MLTPSSAIVQQEDLIRRHDGLLEAAKKLIQVLDSGVIRTAALQHRIPLYEASADLIDAISKAEGRKP